MVVDLTFSDSEFESLLKRATTGSRLELGDLLDAYRPVIDVMAAKAIGSRLRARVSKSDLVQDTMLVASCRFGDFRGTTIAEFRAWLFQIFSSRVADNVRRHVIAEKRRNGLERTELCDGLSDDSPSASSVVRVEEESQKLLKAIASLSEKDRKIVLMRYAGQQSFEEISQQLSLPLTTVWRRWVKALDELRCQLS